jgi:nickel/cobalt transporter (NicO) family protein
MEHSLGFLIMTAASLGFIHTLVGPDHYVPFSVISKARNWSLTKTMGITFLCGVGHILSSVVLGFIGIAFGIAVTKLNFIESQRGEIAAWLLIVFGLFYMVWGIRRAVQNKSHVHLHVHTEGEVHKHVHVHREDHTHLHTRKEEPNLTPWILFTIFVFGPCEPLIPLIMYPAAKGSLAGVFWVAATFGAVTIATMMTLVALTRWGIQLLPFMFFERYMHAMAGGTILFCGLAIRFMGL